MYKCCEKCQAFAARRGKEFEGNGENTVSEFDLSSGSGCE
jgi:hypothetical protein